MKFKSMWSKWDKRERQVSLLNFLIAGDIKPSEDYLDLIKTRYHGVIASTDVNYSYAIFGRDSLEVAEDLLKTHKKLANEIILTLAKLQGVETDHFTEEEPGKIHHEYRSRKFEGRNIPDQSYEIMKKLQLMWGEAAKEDMVYYGTFDATPLYIRLIGRYVSQYGDGILNDVYVDRLGKRRTIQYSLQQATNWLVKNIESSPWGLLEYKRLNPKGLANQTWKDSETSYIHLDGSLANYDDGIASIELQGYAYDALIAAAELDETIPNITRDKYIEMAEALQQKTVDAFWMPEHNFFAQGLDRDKNGKMRQIKTSSSNAVLVLESNLLKFLPLQKRDKYLKSIASNIYSTEFITPVGVRSRALSHKDLVDFPDYHGSYTVWPKETLDAANGFRNFGLNRLAEQLENRLLNGVTVSGEFYEFFYVDEDNKVAYDQEEVAKFLKSKASTTSSIPQKGQAWVISAVMNIVDKRSAKVQADTHSAFETELLDKIPKVSAVLDAKDILESKPSRMLGYTRKTRRPKSKSKK